MNAADGFAAVASRLRADGVTVIEIPAWQIRGTGPLTPAGIVMHHTAGAVSGGDAASLRICTFGRAGLRNVLCNCHVSRSGVVALVAARTAWHAGAGQWRGVSGNARLIGVEAEHSGGPGEEWTAGSLHAQLSLSRACADEFRFDAGMVCDHKEYATPRGRKIDRFGIEATVFRAQVAGAIGAPAWEDVDDMPQGEIIQADSGPQSEHLYWRMPGGQRVYLRPDTDRKVMKARGLIGSVDTHTVPAALLAQIPEVPTAGDGL